MYTIGNHLFHPPKGAPLKRDNTHCKIGTLFVPFLRCRSSRITGFISSITFSHSRMFSWKSPGDSNFGVNSLAATCLLPHWDLSGGGSQHNNQQPPTIITNHQKLPTTIKQLQPKTFIYYHQPITTNNQQNQQPTKTNNQQKPTTNKNQKPPATT